MESIYSKLALYGSRNECSRTDDVFSPISEVCDGTVSHSFKHKIYQVLFLDRVVQDLAALSS